MGRLGLGLGLGLVLVLRQGLGSALGLQLRTGMGFKRNHSWLSTFMPRHNHSLCLWRMPEFLELVVGRLSSPKFFHNCLLWNVRLKLRTPKFWGGALVRPQFFRFSYLVLKTKNEPKLMFLKRY